MSRMIYFIKRKMIRYPYYYQVFTIPSVVKGKEST